MTLVQSASISSAITEVKEVLTPFPISEREAIKIKLPSEFNWTNKFGLKLVKSIFSSFSLSEKTEVLQAKINPPDAKPTLFTKVLRLIFLIGFITSLVF